MASGHLKTPHQQAEHMAAPTSPCDIVQKTLANSEPSTHGTWIGAMDRQQVAALDLDVGQEALVAADEARRDEGGRELHAGSCYLAVKLQQVVPVQAESADWCLSIEAGMGSMPVVAVLPFRQICFSLV